ncbi:hypothetical protein ES707_05389 [subsurface metagenome]
MALEVISPATITIASLTRVSQATLLFGSCSSIASRTASDMWSAILSGWPIVTDSLVKRYLLVSQCGLVWMGFLAILVFSF